MILLFVCCLCLCYHLGDNCIQHFLLGSFIVGYTVGNLVLQQHASGALNRDFRTYIRRYTSPNENFEYGHLHSNALLQFPFKLKSCKPHKAAFQHCVTYILSQFLTLSNQTARNKSKRIRIIFVRSLFCS